jgi:hypothetical protein
MKQIIFGLSVLLTLASCTKSSTSATENSEILRAGKWRITAFTYKYEKAPGVDTVIDVLNKRDTCYSDDYITFDSSYKGIQHSAKLKCAGELDEMEFDWQLKDNQKTLVLNNAQYTIGNINKGPVATIGKEYVEAKIAKMNKKSMTLTYETKTQILVDLRPTIDTTYFMEGTVYFTQTFEK